MNTNTIGWIIFVVSLIGGTVWLGTQSGQELAVEKGDSNVAVENGVQVIDLTAKGGYTPRSTTASADTPTILRVATNGTFDCSSALTIPSLNYAQNLPPSGTTDITIPPQPAGTKLKGMCSMGMYRFEIAFN